MGLVYSRSVRPRGPEFLLGAGEDSWPAIKAGQVQLLREPRGLLGLIYPPRNYHLHLKMAFWASSEPLKGNEHAKKREIGKGPSGGSRRESCCL